MRMKRLAIGILVLALAIPGLALAQSASVDSPNDKQGNSLNVVAATGADKTMNVRIKTSKTRMVTTGPQQCNPAPLDGESGQLVAARFVNALCTNATVDHICSGLIDLATPCAGLACCAVPPANRVDVTCKTGPQATDPGFTLTRIANDVKFLVSASGLNNKVVAVHTATNGGNSLDIDLLPQPALFQLLPNGVNGTVTYSVFHTQGGQNPKSFNFNTTGLTADQIHDQIVSGFEGLGLGLDAERIVGSDAWKYSHLMDPSAGSFVALHNASAIATSIRSETLEGQLTELATTDTPVVPTLSEWGMIFVAVLLLGTGYWMLRRRRQASGNA